METFDGVLILATNLRNKLDTAFMRRIQFLLNLGVPGHDVRAYMWISLAAARFPPGAVRDLAINGRDVVAKSMSPAEIAEAKRLAREWMAKHKR